MKDHSERVPNKNMRGFCGRPLYHAVMESLIKSRYISRVVINTDSVNIIKDAKEHFGNNILIHDRPQRLIGDFVSMNQIIDYDLQMLDGEHFLQTHSTNPLLQPTTIDRAINEYFRVIHEGYDSLFSVTPIQTRLYTNTTNPVNHNPAHLIRTQDLLPLYAENSCVYIFSRKSFTINKTRIGVQPFMFTIEKLEAWDIDDDIDFQFVEFVYRHLTH